MGSLHRVDLSQHHCYYILHAFIMCDNLRGYSKQLIEMRRLDVKFDLSLADLVLTRHPKSEATFAHRLGDF